MGPLSRTNGRALDGSTRAHDRTRLAWIGLGLAAFALSALVARTGEVPSAEQAVFRWVNGLPEALTMEAVGEGDGFTFQCTPTASIDYLFMGTRSSRPGLPAARSPT